MPLETATYVPDLNVANPAHTDGLSQADSHMRLLKATLKATFPNFTSAPLASTQAALDNAALAAAGGAITRFPLGTALLPGLTPVGDPNTGLWSPAPDQLAYSLAGTQVLLMGGSALVTSLGVAAAAFTTTGAYSGGTGQLVPIGAVLEWYDDVLPTEGGYAWANGVPISRAANPILWTRWGTRFGAGDGTTTFGVPDRRETVGVGKSTMGGAAARGLVTVATLNAVIGTATNTLIANNIPTLVSVNAAQNIVAALPTGSGRFAYSVNGDLNAFSAAGSGAFVSEYSSGNNWALANGLSAVNSISTTYTNSTVGTVDNMQPSSGCNYILRIG